MRRSPSIQAAIAATALFQMVLHVPLARATGYAWSGGPAPVTDTRTDLHFAGAVRLAAIDTFAPSSHLGAVSLRPNTTIDFISANDPSELVFEAFGFISATNADIVQGTGWAGGDGSDRSLYPTAPYLTMHDPRFVQFTDDSGTHFVTAGMMAPDNGYFEIIPMPEPATWVGAAIALFAVAFAQRRRLAAVLLREQRR